MITALAFQTISQSSVPPQVGVPTKKNKTISENRIFFVDFLWMFVCLFNSFDDFLSKSCYEISIIQIS